MKITLEFDPNDESSIRAALKMFTEHIDHEFGKPKQIGLFDDDPLKRMHTNYKNLLNAMISLFGYGNRILRNDKRLKELRYENRVDDLTDFIRSLESRGIFDVEKKINERQRIISFSIRRF
jgi:hypothetical protein